MSVIICARCERHIDTDFHPTYEVPSQGEPLAFEGMAEVCENCLTDEECDDLDGPALLPGEEMDGDFDSGMASAGFGTDEDYGYYGGDE